MSKREELNGAREALTDFGAGVSCMFGSREANPNVDHNTWTAMGTGTLCINGIVSSLRLKSPEKNGAVPPIIPGQRVPHAWSESRLFYPYMRKFVDLSTTEDPDAPVGLVAFSATGLPMEGSDSTCPVAIELIKAQLNPNTTGDDSQYGPGDDFRFRGIKVTIYPSFADGKFVGSTSSVNQHSFFTTGPATEQSTETIAYRLGDLGREDDDVPAHDSRVEELYKNKRLRLALSRVTHSLFRGIRQNELLFLPADGQEFYP